MKDSDILKFAADLGSVMLASGAETYRVEDTIVRILSVGGDRYPECFVTTTGIFICINNYQDDPFTVLRRIKTRGTNLEKLIAANALSRDFTSGKIVLKEAAARLEEIKSIKSFRPGWIFLGNAAVSGGFAIMLGSTVTDGICAAVVGMILGVFIYFFEKSRSEVLFKSFLGGIILSVLAVAAIKTGIGGNMDSIIIGAIMPLVPGVAITTAIRDIMEGDYVSGVSRMMEAILTAVAIAGGAGFALMTLGGVLI